MCDLVEGCLYSPSGTERPLGAFREEKGISNRLWVSNLAQHVECNIEVPFFLPSENGCLRSRNTSFDLR